MLATKLVCVILFIVPTLILVTADDSTDWWRKAAFYQVYPRSFQDSNGDGVGDLQGIAQKVHYFEYLGIDGVWISPVFESPMKDMGYDISNYTNIDPIFGTIDGFREMLREMKSRGIKVVLDFVPNHTSDKHVWFNKSRNREDPYTDYYIWRDGKNNDSITPPNNWISVFAGSGWTWCDIRKQWYYHQFLTEQPDVNFRNPRVVQEMKDVIRFWLELGIDGIRVDAVKHVFEDPLFRDEPLSGDPNARPDQYNYLSHIYTLSQPEIFPIVREWRDLFDEFQQRDGFYRVMMLESGEPPERTRPYYGNATYPLADLPFNFQIVDSVGPDMDAARVFSLIDNWVKVAVPPTKWSNWQVGNHDHLRVASRTGPEWVDAWNMLNLLLKGTPITYYGEEIGMVDTFVSWNETVDPMGKFYGEAGYLNYSRDPARTPMQWDSTAFAGFTSGKKTWLPVNPNYPKLNVAIQKLDERSHLATYRRLVQLRKKPVIHESEVEYVIHNKNVFAFARAMRGAPCIAVVINFGSDHETIDVIEESLIERFMFPKWAVLEAASKSFAGGELDHFINLGELRLGPREGVVVSFEPSWAGEN